VGARVDAERLDLPDVAVGGMDVVAAALLLLPGGGGMSLAR
jgi:ribose 5-phosphate isomerase